MLQRSESAWVETCSAVQAEKLVKHGSGNDTLLVTIWNKIGDHHADRHRWHKVKAHWCQTEMTHMLHALVHPAMAVVHLQVHSLPFR